MASPLTRSRAGFYGRLSNRVYRRPVTNDSSRTCWPASAASTALSSSWPPTNHQTQTREHFAICRLPDVRTGVVAITTRSCRRGHTRPRPPGLKKWWPGVSSPESRSCRCSVTGLVWTTSGARSPPWRKSMTATLRRCVFRLPIDRVFTMRVLFSNTGTTFAGRINPR